MRLRVFVVAIVIVCLVVGAAAIAFNDPTPAKAIVVMGEGSAQLTNLGEVGDSNITKMEEDGHVCYILTSKKWTNVSASINCPQ